MKESFAIWCMECNNMMGCFDTEREALAFVLRGIELHGPDDPDTFALNVEDADGNVTFIATGAYTRRAGPARDCGKSISRIESQK